MLVVLIGLVPVFCRVKRATIEFIELRISFKQPERPVSATKPRSMHLHLDRLSTVSSVVRVSALVHVTQDSVGARAMIHHTDPRIIITMPMFIAGSRSSPLSRRHHGLSSLTLHRRQASTQPPILSRVRFSLRLQHSGPWLHLEPRTVSQPLKTMT